MEALVSSALMIRLSLQPSPASDASAFNKIRAFSSRWAGLFPFRISPSSRSRSSPLTAEAIDSLGLKVKAQARPVSKPGRRLRAQELATKGIEKLSDPTPPPEERA